MGPIGPDLLAPLAVFIALYARRQIDVLLAGWAIGMAIDLAASGGPGSASVVGPMALTYVLGTKVIYTVRDAFFRERIISRAVLTAVFCLVAHCLWVTAQSAIAYRHTSWPEYGRMLLQAVGLAIYTAALAPSLIWLLEKGRKWIIQSRSGTARHGR